MIRRLVHRYWWLPPIAYILAVSAILRAANRLDTWQRGRR